MYMFSMYLLQKFCNQYVAEKMHPAINCVYYITPEENNYHRHFIFAITNMILAVSKCGGKYNKMWYAIF